MSITVSILASLVQLVLFILLSIKMKQSKESGQSMSNSVLKHSESTDDLIRTYEVKSFYERLHQLCVEYTHRNHKNPDFESPSIWFLSKAPTWKHLMSNRDIGLQDLEVFFESDVIHRISN